MTIRNRPLRALWPALVLALLAGAGCVERALVITSDPPGASVVVNNRWKGVTPFAVPFRDYGVFAIELEHENYYPLRVAEPVKAPIHDVAGLDFFSNVLYPGKISDLRELHYRLEPRTGSVDKLEDVQARVAALRAERDRRIADRDAKDSENHLHMPALPKGNKRPDLGENRRAASIAADAGADAGTGRPVYTPPVPVHIPVDIPGLQTPNDLGIRYGPVPAAPELDYPGVPASPVRVARSPVDEPAGLSGVPAAAYTPPVPSDIPFDIPVLAATPAPALRYAPVPAASPRAAESPIPAPPATPAPAILEADARETAWNIVPAPPAPDMGADPDRPILINANPPSMARLDLDADWIESTVLR